MVVMLSKIFILLAGQPSETFSYLADMESEKKEAGGEGVHPLLKCQDVINSYKVNMEDFNLCLCQDKDFTVFGSHTLSLFLSTFLALSQFLIYSQLYSTVCVTLSWFCS